MSAANPLWLNENLATFDEQVRIEKGPQIIELNCNKETLSNDVTSAHYKVGARDAEGKIILGCSIDDPEIDPALHARALNDPYGYISPGETMKVIDWKEKFIPSVWKVYLNKGGLFQQVNSFSKKDDAIHAVQQMLGGT